MDEIVSAPLSASEWHFDHEGGELRVTFLTDAIVRIALTPWAAQPHRTWSVIPMSDLRRATAVTVTQDAAIMELTTPALTLTLDHQSGTFFVRQANGVIICDGVKLTDQPNGRRWEMGLAENARILGGGERTGPLDRRGRTLTFWVNDALPNYDEKTDAMFQSVSFLTQVSVGMVSGLFFDSNWYAQADIGESNMDRFVYTTSGPDLVAYLCAGPTFPETLAQYASITGLMPPQPRWSFGYHQSRWGYTSAEDVRAIATTMREQQIPCDAIHLDLDYMDGYRDFTWNAERFPDPTALVRELREQGIHVVTIIDPGVKIDPNYAVYREGLALDYFIRSADDTPFEGWVWPGRSVWADFAQEQVRDWWGKQQHALLDAGVAGLWIDMNEPTQADMWAPEGVHIPHGTSLPLDTVHGPDEQPLSHAEFHNAYGLEMAHATQAGLLSQRPGERPFVLTRAATAGSQRHAIVWNGDTTSSWEHLRLAIPMNLGMGLSGIPITGCDLGGFWGNTTPELLTRFMQLGALLPFCRNHSAIDTQPQEPWSFGEPYTSIIRAAIERRYRLLPLLITLAHEASEMGTPMMRPLAWLSPDDVNCLSCNDQFLLGNDLMIAPVIVEGATSRNVYFPTGEWQAEDGRWYRGPDVTTIPVTLETMLLFQRAGSVLPKAEVTQHTSEAAQGPLDLEITLTPAAPRAEMMIWDDDDHPQAKERGTFACYVVKAEWQGEVITIRLSQHSGEMAMRYPALRARLHLPQGTYTLETLPAQAPLQAEWHFLIEG